MGVPVKKSDKGESTYTLARKLSLTLNAVTSFSNRPLYFIFAIGMAISLCSFCLAAMYFSIWLFVMETSGSGFTSLIISIWMVGGLVMLSLGVIGIYLAKMFSEVKPRPYTVIRELFFDRKDGDGQR
jgi:putative glycosyltransferase